MGVNQKLNLFMAQECMRLMNPFVPMDTGALSQTVETKATNESGGSTLYCSLCAQTI